MNGFDIQRFERAKEIADTCGLKITINGSMFSIFKEGIGFLGKVETINDLYFFIAGYDWGYSHGKTMSVFSGEE